MLRVANISILLILLGSLGCGGHKAGGPTTPTTPMQMSCPADISVRAVPGATQPVTFDPPTVTGGSGAVQTSCNPASGSAFPLGTTAVNCSASDAAARATTCSFRINLTGFSIALTRYEAFGDSITAGETGRPSVAGLDFIDLPNAYPTQLQQRFDAVYPGQGLVVINRGHSLDTVAETDALIRIFAAADRPEVVLLLSGYNNLTQACGSNGGATPACRNAIGTVGADIRSCIRHAREVDGALKFIFVSTLTPPGASGSNRVDRNAIVQANDQIRQAALSEHAVVVDSYAAFLGREPDYVNVDGLHLTPAGYQALAAGFFSAIQSAVEQIPLFH